MHQGVILSGTNFVPQGNNLSNWIRGKDKGKRSKQGRSKQSIHGQHSELVEPEAGINGLHSGQALPQFLQNKVTENTLSPGRDTCPLQHYPQALTLLVHIYIPWCI